MLNPHRTPLTHRIVRSVSLGKVICGIFAVLIVCSMASESAYAQCTYLYVYPNAYQFPVSGGWLASSNVYTDNGCPWTTYPSAYVYTSPQNGTGPGYFYIYVEPNTGNGRNLGIWVYPQWGFADFVSIYQEGNPLFLTATPNDLTIPGSITYNVGEPYIPVDLEFYKDGAGPDYTSNYANFFTNSTGGFSVFYGYDTIPAAGTYVFTRARNMNDGQWIDIADTTVILRAP